MITKFRTIKSRMIFYVSFIIILISTLINGIIYIFDVSFYNYKLDKQLSTHLDVFSASVANPLWDYNYDAIEAINDAIVKHKEILRIELYDNGGTLISLYQSPTSTIDFDTQSDPSLIYGERTIYFEGKYVGIVTIYLTNQTLHDELVLQILKNIFLSTSILFCLFIGVKIIAERIAKPIEEMSSVSLSISSGIFDNTITYNQPDELGELANTIIVMQKQLKENQIEITSKITELNDNYLNTVTALANSIEASDLYTRGHCERVCKFSLHVGSLMGISEKDMKTLEYASILHDVGKIGIPTNIISKPSQLTSEEFDLVKQHPILGYNIIKEISFLKDTTEAILQHHERIDGKGYPNGLKGNEICLLARIISVVDAFDAMTSSRPYRKNPLTKEEAIDQLLRGIDTQFDKEVVEYFILYIK